MSEKSAKEGKVKELMRLCQSYIAKFGTQTTQTFVDAKLNDGTTVVRFPNDKMSKGDAVSVVTEEGELPLPDSAADAPYILEDGTSFTIVNGAIDIIVETEKDPEKAPETPPSPDKTKTEMENKPKRVIKSNVEEHVFAIEFEKEVVEIDLSEMFSANNKKIEALEKENKSLTEKFTAQLAINKGLAETIELIADEPAADPIEKKKLEAKKFEEMNPLERYRFLKQNEK